ncbi:hypothetical protein PORCRE_1507 [Porphyromonas crevioricanis JCM 15906]|uniref:Uncharacterized protein n=1 Tax=Porphyromonas crevioricanis JCM 15906 TaxID=1305617 RepID=T1DTG5_9PORP|nr:hypothetical protein PORCRE_1507 [Porphyromonas crevioricanis JCM 15906]
MISDADDLFYSMIFLPLLTDEGVEKRPHVSILRNSSFNIIPRLSSSVDGGPHCLRVETVYSPADYKDCLNTQTLSSGV